MEIGEDIIIVETRYGDMFQAALTVGQHTVETFLLVNIETQPVEYCQHAHYQHQRSLVRKIP